MDKKHILSMQDLTAQEIEGLLALAISLKAELKNTGHNRPLLAGHTLAMLFEKPSLRTKLSFEVGMTQLGGHAVYLGPSEVGMGVRESTADVARVAGSMAQALMARVYRHDTLVELAAHASCPVINGLSDLEHPCQILADVLTIQEQKGFISGLHVAFVGDAENNIVHSLGLAAGLLGFTLSIASPQAYAMNPAILKKAKQLAAKSKGVIYETNDPTEAVRHADIVYTDTWVSMGDEQEKEERVKALAAYQVNSRLMSFAKPDALFMHDLPAYRGQEVSVDVIDGPQSVVFDQAENRLHAQKALLVWLMGEYVDGNTKKGLV